MTALPSEGYDGAIPEFPLSKRRYQVLDEEETQLVADRELELWEWAWRTPQACAWSMEPWRWQSVAMWVRTFVICEGDEAKAADKGAIHRFADQIGLTPAGLKENGWAIAADEVAAKRAEKVEPAEAPSKPQRRLRAVDGAS